MYQMYCLIIKKLLNANTMCVIDNQHLLLASNDKMTVFTNTDMSQHCTVSQIMQSCFVESTVTVRCRKAFPICFFLHSLAEKAKRHVSAKRHKPKGLCKHDDDRITTWSVLSFVNMCAFHQIVFFCSKPFFWLLIRHLINELTLLVWLVSVITFVH